MCRLEKPHYKAWSFPLLILTYHTTAESTEPSLEKNSNKPVYWLNLWFPQTIVNVKVVHKTFVKEMKMPFLSPSKKKKTYRKSGCFTLLWYLFWCLELSCTGELPKKWITSKEIASLQEENILWKDTKITAERNQISIKQSEESFWHVAMWKM